MLHILLVILKVIGIIIAVILLLILFLLSIILWVPIRYRIKFVYQSEMNAVIKVSWLLHLVSTKFTYQDGQTNFVIKIFGISLQQFAAWLKKVRGRKRKIKKSRKANKKIGAERNTFSKEELPVGTEPPLSIDTAIEKKDESLICKNELETKEKKNTKNKPKSENAGQKIVNFCKRFIEKIKKILLDFKNKLQNIKYTIIRICGRIRNIRDFISDKENQAAFLAIKNQLIALLQRILPKRYHGRLHFGTGDPASTGQILGIISLFYPVFQDNVRIVPNFEEAVVEAEFYARGRITVFTVLLSLFRLYRDKNVKKLIEQIKK